MDFDYEEPIEKRFEDLCQDLCIEESIREEAWDKYKVHPTGSDLFRFTWLLFIKSRASFPAVTDDLVNSYHLLACCLDWVLGIVLLSRRPDLINMEMASLPKDFIAAVSQKKAWCPPHDEAPCMLRPICEENGVNYVECKTVKEHFFRPFLVRLIEKSLLKIHPHMYGSLLESENFEISLQNLNNNYEEYIIGTGDFDERIYLNPNATEEIGSIVDRGLQSSLGLSTDIASSGRRCVLELNTIGFGGFSETTRRGNSNAGAVSRLNGGINFNNPEARAQNMNQLQIILSGRSKEPSEALIELIESHCSINPLATIQSIVDIAVAQFQTAYTQYSYRPPTAVASSDLLTCGGTTSLAISASQQRLHLGCTLYYLALESILFEEVRRMERRCITPTATTDAAMGPPPARRRKPDLTSLLSQESFLNALFACCMEFVLISCDPSDRHFPWILDVMGGLDALQFFKVIEVVIRNIDFSRDVIKYMNQVTELILDSYAWRSRSSLWAVLKAAGRAPSIEEVMPQEKLEQSTSGAATSTASVTAPNSRTIDNLSDMRKPYPSLVLKTSSSSPLKSGPRLLTSTLTSGGLLRPRGSMVNSGSSMLGDGNTGGHPPRHILLHGPQSSLVEDESAQAAAQLLASGSDILPPDAGATPQHDANASDVSDGFAIPWSAPTPGSNLSATTAPTIAAAVSAPPSTTAALTFYPTRHDSLAIFFRQFYTLASQRLRDLSDRLNLQRDLMYKIWTCCEQVVVHETELLRDRCLDQIILSALHGVCKVMLYRPLTFIDIIQSYRMQPQSNRDIYRRVLIHPSSPSSTKKGTVTSSLAMAEDRGDVARFYNIVYLPLMREFIRKVAWANCPGVQQTAGSGVPSVTGPSGDSQWMAAAPTLAPMPAQYTHGTGSSTSASGATNQLANALGAASGALSDVTQAKRLASNRNIFISPVKQQPVNLSPKRVIFTVGRSTGKDLQDVNIMISSAERRASMANLAMGLRRPGGGGGGGISSMGLSNSSGFTVQSAGGAGGTRTVTLVPTSGHGGLGGGFMSKRVDFDL